MVAEKAVVNYSLISCKCSTMNWDFVPGNAFYATMCYFVTNKSKMKHQYFMCFINIYYIRKTLNTKHRVRNKIVLKILKCMPPDVPFMKYLCPEHFMDNVLFKKLWLEGC